ncbi:MAG: CotH kinase family protein [Flavobacteriales bacterium]|nr:CotH kinase family protein [Flavobacteriales bacterium]MCB9198102.1 CotH kinase family protein [Flavobacteriales bacterium]
MRFALLPLLLISLQFFAQLNKDLFMDRFPESGMYAIDIKIKPKQNEKVYYTTSGSFNATELHAINSELTINKTTSLLIKIKSDEVDTIIQRSYHFDYVSKFPIISINIDPEDLWNDSTGIYVKGKYAYWSDSTGHWENCNYQKKWEKEIYATYIDTNNIVGFSQHCGLKLFGESTRRQPDKSMKIVAREEFGDGDFSYQIFPQKQISSFKQIAIRTSGNDFNGSRFKDALSAYLARNLGLDYMAYQPVNLFINGEYWGVYNLREKVNEHFIAANHNVNPDSVNIIMGRWITQEGSNKQYMKMYHWFEQLDTMDNEAYEIAKKFLDVRNYINFRVFQIYINNKDSRGNIRYYNISGRQPQFRMILYDTDLGYGSYSFNFLEGCLSPTPTEWYNPTWSTMYLTKLMQHQEFRNDFVTQFAHLMNTSLHRDTILSAVEMFEEIYVNELPKSSADRPAHLKKVIFPKDKWQEDVETLKSYAKLRPKVMWDHIKNALNLSGTYTLLIDVDSINVNGKIKINDNYALPLVYSGRYYKNIPLKIEIIPDSLHEFLAWEDGDTNRIRVLNTSSDTVMIKPTFGAKTMSNASMDMSNEIQLKAEDINESKALSAWIIDPELLFWIAIGLIITGFGMVLFYFIRK